MELALDRSWEGCRVVAAQVDALERPGAFERALAEVSESRRRKVLAYRFARDQRTSLLAGMLLDELLGDFGLRERDMTYCENEHGKPFFAGRPDLFFSLAHSGRMAVAALAAYPIGVDVEDLSSFPYDCTDPRTWTTMESVGKAIGIGVGPYVDSGTFAVPDGFRVEHLDCAGHLVCIAFCAPR